jgi:Tfp pilus assembly protein PilV
VRSEKGLTMVEVVVAAMVVTVGMLGAFLMLNTAVHVGADQKARAGAVTLARQLTEDAREIDYSQLTSGALQADLQAMPGMSSSSSGSPWTIARNGVTYTVTASLMSFNETKDSNVPTECDTSSTACDIKQVMIQVTWSTFQGLQHSYSETATMTRAGQDPGLTASSLVLASPTSGYDGTSSAPVIYAEPSSGSLQFSVTAPSGTVGIVWTLNGKTESAWSPSTQSGTTWTSAAWSIPGSGSTAVSDGTYTIGAQAEDSSGVDGPAVTISVKLVRNVPSAPSMTGYGFNPNFMSGGSATTAAEFEWSANPELNVIGYQITNPSGIVICRAFTSTSYPANCGVNGGNAWCSSVLSCVDMSPPSVNSSSLTYEIAALYYDANDDLQAGTASSATLASGPPTPPSAPSSLTVSSQSDGSAYISWTPPSGGTAVSFYRIYREGDAYTDRYDTLTCSSSCSYHDTDRSGPHEYYVTAVGGTTPGADMAESKPTGPVTG